MLTLNIINQTTLASPDIIAAIAAAIQIQVSRDFAPHYRDARMHVSTSDDGSGYPVWLVDTEQDSPPGALAWHTIDAMLRPYAICPVKPVLDGGWELGPTVSHEILELLADPWCMSTVNATWNGVQAFLSYEVCDPTEDASYPINGIPVSDFVLPAWFHAQGTCKVDFMGLLSSALTLTPGGYVQYMRGGEWRDDWGHAARAFRLNHGHHSRRNRKRRQHQSLAGV